MNNAFIALLYIVIKYTTLREMSVGLLIPFKLDELEPALQI